MMETNRQKKADRYLIAANLGTAAALAYPLLYLSMILLTQGFVGENDPTIGTSDIVLIGLWLLSSFAFVVIQTGAIFYIFFRRRTDELTSAMWSAGTTFAFFAAIVWLLLGGMVENYFEAIFAADAYQESLERAEQAAATGDLSKIETNDLWQIGPDVIRRFAVPVILAAFYLGFQLKRFRGGM